MVNLGGRRHRIIQQGLGHREIAEDAVLRVKVLDFVVQHGPAGSLGNPGRPGHHEQRHLFGPGVGHRVGQLKPPHAVGAADHSESPQPGKGVRRKAGPLLIRGHQHGQPSIVQCPEKPERIVANNPESHLHTVFGQAAHQMPGDGRFSQG